MATLGTLLLLLRTTNPAQADGGATIIPLADGSPCFYCGEFKDVTYSYDPDPVGTPIRRAYSVQIIAP